MTAPRQLLPGSTYLITRRCSERRFFLRPDPFVEELFGYLLGVASERFGVDIHAAVVLSNHYDAVVTDWDAKLPRFLHWVHRLAAAVLNAYRGRREGFWSSDKPSVVRLETADDILSKMVYTMANGVAAGLVSRAADWPGLSSRPDSLLDAEGKRYERPSVYFDADGKTREFGRLRFVRPPGFDDLSGQELADLLAKKLEEREEEHRATMKANGRSFVGKAALLRVDWNASPSTSAPRRVRSPHIAARSRDRRQRAIERLREFRRQYREARLKLREGDQNVTFPAGTYGLRLLMGVRCHAPPDDICWSRAA